MASQCLRFQLVDLCGVADIAGGQRRKIVGVVSVANCSFPNRNARLQTFRFVEHLVVGLAGWEGAIDPHKSVLPDGYAELVSEPGFVKLVGVPLGARKNSWPRNSTVGAVH